MSEMKDVRVKALGCPFCGSEPRRISVMGAWAPGGRGYEPNGVRYSCPNCSGLGDAHYGDDMEAKALAAWNSRSALEPAPKPAGGEWVMVPREPTEAMQRAGQVAADDHHWKWCGYGERKEGEGLDGMMFHVREGYRAMLTAAPPPPSADAQDVGEPSQTIGEALQIIHERKRMIERAARAAFDRWWDNRGPGAETSWLSTRAKWIGQQTAALDAALPQGEDVGGRAERLRGALLPYPRLSEDFEGLIASLSAKVAEVKRERDEAETERTDMMWQRRRAEETAKAAEARASELQREVERKDKALIWYENNVAGCRLIHSGGDSHRAALAEDGGNRARAALQQEGESDDQG